MTNPDDIQQWHRVFGPRFFNRTWELLDLSERTPEQDDEMLTAAFAQRAHWYEVGTPTNKAIADWQLSRVAAVLGLGELASRFARHSLEMCRRHDVGPFYLAYAHEALARAAALTNEDGTYRDHVQAARDVATRIDDDEERAMVLADLDMI